MRLTCLILLSCLLAPSVARAQDEYPVISDAKELFDEGVKLYKKGQHAQALERFKESYALRPHWKIHLNMGLCYKQLSMYVEARAEFDAFLEEGDGKLSKKDLKLVKEAIADLEKITAFIWIEFVTSGVTVEIDGRDVTQEALEGPVEVDPGAHVVKASKPGHPSHEEELILSKSEHRTVSIELAGHDSTGTPGAWNDEGKKSKKGSKLAPLFWVAGGLTVAFATVAIATGAVAVDKHNQVETLDDRARDLFESGGYTDEEYEGYTDARRPLYKDGKALSQASTAFIVLAGAALAGTVVAGVLTHPFGKKEEQPGSVALDVAPVPVDGGAVLVVGGSF